MIPTGVVPFRLKPDRVAAFVAKTQNLGLKGRAVPWACRKALKLIHIRIPKSLTFSRLLNMNTKMQVIFDDLVGFGGRLRLETKNLIVLAMRFRIDLGKQ